MPPQGPSGDQTQTPPQLSGSPCSAPTKLASALTAFLLTRLQQAEFLSVPSMPLSNDLWGSERADPFARCKPACLLPTCSLLPISQSQFRHVSSRNPALAPRSPGRVPRLNPPALVCPPPRHCIIIVPLHAHPPSRLLVPGRQGHPLVAPQYVPSTRHTRGAQEIFLTEEVVGWLEGVAPPSLTHQMSTEH